eukprot:GGOE01031280.1.p1 GENE.GGOE01031280.1~~GGOE01031280.1.p1  ORF type:complete len:147 (-),score=2.58 GGOE01031280.1:531-971(-)
MLAIFLGGMQLIVISFCACYLSRPPSADGQRCVHNHPSAICFPRHSMSHTSLPTRRRAATHAAVQQSLPLPPLPSQVVVNVGEPPFCTRKCNSCDPKAPLLQPCSRPLLLDYCKPLSHPSEEGTSPSAALCPGSLPTQQVTSPVVL